MGYFVGSRDRGSRLQQMAVVVSVVVLALFTGLSAAQARTHAVVTLTLLQINTLQPAQDVLIQNFERVYPNIHIDVTYFDGNTLFVPLLTEFQAGNAPDLFQANPGNTNPGSVWPLAKAGKLLDLTGSPWVKRIYPPVKRFVQFNALNGKGTRIYGMPYAIGIQGLVYNVDAFNQLGIKPATTMAQLIDQCKTIRAAGKIPIAAGFAGSLLTALAFGQLGWNSNVYSVDPLWDVQRNANKVTFASSPLWHNALQTVVDLNQANCFQPAPEGTTVQAAISLFATGQALMIPLAAASTPAINTINPDLHWQMAPLPAYDATNTRVSGGVGISLSGNAATAHPQEVKDFIDFMARVKQDSLFTKINGTVAPYDAEHGILPASMAPMVPLFKAGKVSLSPTAEWPNPSELTTYYLPSLVGLLTGQKTVDDILKDMDAHWFPPTS